jgi:DNA-binding MarR family transcriptional regulator
VTDGELTETDYQTLAGFRRALRGFAHFSEAAAEGVGLTPQQHQALLAIRAENGLTVGELADRLSLKPHSATGLVDRLVKSGLLVRQTPQQDRRRAELAMTDKSDGLLRALSDSHRAELRRLKPLLIELLQKI